MSDSDSDDEDLQPIHNAAIRGDLAALRRELEAGVSPDCVGTCADGVSVTPLLILCSSDTTHGPGFVGPDDIRLQAVKILLAAGASPNHIIEGVHIDSPLYIATSYAQSSVVKALIAAGADPTYADDTGWTPLHGAALNWSHSSSSRIASCAVALLRAGAAVNAVYNEEQDGGWTPLRWCLHGGHGRSHNRLIPVFLRFGATLDTTLIESYNGMASHAYLAKVHAAGGWKRYAQAHTARLAPIFVKVFPHARLPPELVSHIVDLWAHVGFY